MAETKLWVPAQSLDGEVLALAREMFMVCWKASTSTEWDQLEDIEGWDAPAVYKVCLAHAHTVNELEHPERQGLSP